MILILRIYFKKYILNLAKIYQKVIFEGNKNI